MIYTHAGYTIVHNIKHNIRLLVKCETVFTEKKEEVKQTATRKKHKVQTGNPTDLCVFALTINSDFMCTAA